MAARDESDQSDHGSVTPYIVLLFSALVVMVGLVLGGGSALEAHAAAYAAALQAARAGAADLNEGALESGRSLLLNVEASQTAESALSQSGYAGTVSVSGNTVTVTVSPLSIPTPLLAVLGFASFTVSTSASATLVAG